MKRKELVMGFHAFARGFGWILIEMPALPLDWGVVEKGKDRNARCLLRFERLLDRCRPDILAVEAYDPPHASRAPRIRALCDLACAAARERDARVHVYPRAVILETFEAKSRHEIATAVARHITPLDLRLPRKRAIWESESPNMALFSAAAAALTHCARGR